MLAKKIALFLTAFFVLITPASAIDFDTVKNHIPTGYVSDFAGALKDPQKIENEIDQIEKDTTAEIAVIIIDQLPDNYVLENFATDIFRAWGIGKKQNDNGLLILVSINDHKFRIETGYGTEGTIPDIVAAKIANKYFPTYFRQGDYDTGIYLAVQDFGNILRGDETIVADLNAEDNYSDQADASLIFILIWLVAFVFMVKKPYNYYGQGAGAAIAFFTGGAGMITAYLTLLGFAYVIKLIIYGIKNGGGTGGGGSWDGSSSSSSSWSSGSSGGSSFGGFGGGFSGGGGYSGGW